MNEAKYYRYEYLNSNGQWSGIFDLFDPTERRTIARCIKEPKWYKANPYRPSRCWFTAYGYEKYSELIQRIIQNHAVTYGNQPTIRILTSNHLNHIVSNGKVQCIEIP